MTRQIISVVALGAASVLATTTLKSLWQETDECDRAPGSCGRGADTYLQSIMDRLYSEFKGNPECAAAPTIKKKGGFT